MIKAVLWDVDGTMAETESEGHRVAFNKAFELNDVPWRWDVPSYGELLKVTGGFERLMHDMRTRSDVPVQVNEREALARRIHHRKNEIYADLIRSPGIPLRPGVREMFDECRTRGVTMGIVTTTSRVNVQALLSKHLGPDWAQWFGVMVCGENVAMKKPAPDAYEEALQRLSLDPLQCVAIEDSPGGVASAQAAGVPVVVTRSVYFAQATVEDVIAIGPGLHQRAGWQPEPQAGSSEARVTLDDLVDWQSRMEYVSQHDSSI